MSIPIIDAEHCFPAGNLLGEGILWDSKTQLLHWVDIDKSELHTLDPETMKCSIDVYPESKFLSTIALRKDQPGFIATTQHAIVILPEATAPFSSSPQPTPHTRKSEKTLAEPLNKDELPKTRFNDGACDPFGSFLGGSMTAPGTPKDGKLRGELFRYDPDGTCMKLLDGVGTANGLGWSPDHKTLFYVDSNAMMVATYPYEPKAPLGPHVVLAHPPPVMAGKETLGVFDGLTMDGVGNVWVARWSDERIVGYTPEGKIIAFIRTPKCRAPTIPCFGGPNLETMYITGAKATLSGGDQSAMPHSGDILKVDFSEGSEIRKLLGPGWKGAERHRFGG